MNFIKNLRLIPTLAGITKSVPRTINSRSCDSVSHIHRTFSSLSFGQQTALAQRVSHLQPSTVSEAPFIQVSQPCRTYKHKDILKRRCAGCYFVKKFGILHVECDLKPRHKQMQKTRGGQIYRDDYSKGKWKGVVHWGWKRRAFYKMADPKFVKYDWLNGRIGTEV